jgi:hypothetical protein
VKDSGDTEKFLWAEEKRAGWGLEGRQGQQELELRLSDFHSVLFYQLHGLAGGEPQQLPGNNYLVFVPHQPNGVMASLNDSFCFVLLA